MNNKYFSLSFSVVTILAILLLLSPVHAAQIKKVFIVHSYENGHICGQPQHDGVIDALEQGGWNVGDNVFVKSYYMDTKRKNNTPELIEEQASLALQEISIFNPDIVVTLDDNAFRTIALPNSQSNTQYVFSGMNGQPELYNQKNTFLKSRQAPGYNITGVYEKLYIQEAIEVLSSMHELDTILYLGDLSPTGKAITKQFDLETSNAQGLTKTNIQKTTIHSWEEYVQVIEEINNNDNISAFYLGTLLLKDKGGKTFTPPDIIKYTLDHSKKPAIGLNYAFIKLGLYGGATVDFFSMGELVGKKVVQILNGEETGSIPIEDAPRMALVFNLERAEQLGLEIPSDVLLAADEVFRK